MARGKKHDKQTIYNIVANYAVTGNFHETARQLNMPQKSVEYCVKRHFNDPEFAQLRSQKKEDFASKASEIIDTGLDLLDRRLKTAFNHERELDKLIQEIYTTDNKKISLDEKSKLIAKIRTLQIQRLGDITTAIGTLYDKRALAFGESTEHISFTLPDEVKKYAK